MSTTQDVKFRAASVNFDHKQRRGSFLHKGERCYGYGIGRLEEGCIFGCPGMPAVVVSRTGDNIFLNAKVDLRIAAPYYNYEPIEVLRGECVEVSVNTGFNITWQDHKKVENELWLKIWLNHPSGKIHAPRANDATPNTATNLPTKRPATRSQAPFGVDRELSPKKMRLLPPVVATPSVDPLDVDPLDVDPPVVDMSSV